ncbi:MAG: aspartate/glutamate racemase family protein [Firmicutes bacterium]|nr:aspartate/glutamate racemase family protein [Bacillota bacterium]
MKTIGLLGGMSWESSAEYYRIINQSVRDRLGGSHSARCVMYSVDFAEIETLQNEGDWEAMTRILADAAGKVARGGADLILLCTNTMHKVFDAISASVSVPMIHIADAAALRVKEAGINRVGLLGTRFTMEQDFYKGRLAARHGLEVITPDERERQVIHDVIYNELCRGIIDDRSRKYYLKVIEGLVDRGCQGIVLGCTEIPLLIKQQDTETPLFDTTTIHARKAVEEALS